MKQRIQATILFLFFFAQTTFAQYYSFEKIPKWVKTIDIPEGSSFSKYDIVTGYYLKLLDYQVNLKENAVFNREVLNVVSYSGITNASQLAVSLDTSYQKLQIHHLYIWRKGEKIDRTKEMSFEMMNKEDKLQEGVYTGQMSAYDILTDIRKDDLIDFAYTLIGKNPIFNDEKYLIVPLEALNPIDLFSFRVLYKKDKNYVYKCVGCDSLISTSELNDYRQIEIQNRNIKALILEDNMPSWIIPYRYFLLSSLKSWPEVNQWAQSVFALKSEPNLDAVFKEIFTGKETTDEKINKIINYVQDEIRYMGNEAGLGSIKPRSPEVVIKQRYGDCKDKSLLLVSLLKKIGISESYPALVNTQIQHEIDKLGPGTEIFNHCIVTFKYNGESYWIDPSIPMQGGDFKDMYITDYGKALIVGLSADSLQTMMTRKTNAYSDIIEEITITSFTKPAQLKTISTRYGYDADMRRILLEYYSTNNLLDDLSKELKLLFPIVNKTSEMAVVDNVEKNEISTTYSFEVDGFWRDGDKEKNDATRGLWIFNYEPMLLYYYFTKSACEGREFDAALNYPVNLNYHVTFNCPKEIFIMDNYYSIDNESFFFEQKLEQLSSKSFRIDYKISTKANYVKSKDYKKICEQKNKIVNKLPIAIYFTK